MPFSNRFSLVLVLSLVASISIVSACALSFRDIGVSDASVWRHFWRNELDDVGGDDDGIFNASKRAKTTTSATTTTLTPKHPPVSQEPQPPIWPDVFHALLFQTRNGTASLVDLYYDSPRGRNANVIRRQLGGAGEALYDVEYNNKTSFYFTRPSPSPYPSPSPSPSPPSCRTVTFPVGILPPNWLAGARYLGKSNQNGFECHGWAKGQGRPADLDFVHYYSRITDGVPVRWKFHVGAPMEMTVMSFDVGKEMSDEEWQAPRWCFEGSDEGDGDDDDDSSTAPSSVTE